VTGGHGLLVGYGSNTTNITVNGTNTTQNISYWIVQNSWGTGWGMQGYVYIAINETGSGWPGYCGINKNALYPYTIAAVNATITTEVETVHQKD
jgi:hypothetical protein